MPSSIENHAILGRNNATWEGTRRITTNKEANTAIYKLTGGLPPLLLLSINS